MWRPQSSLLRYGLAIAVTLVAILLRGMLDSALGAQISFETFYLALFVTAVLAGAGPTLLSVALIALLASWLFIPPTNSLLPDSIAGAITLLLFCVFGVALAFLSRWLDRSAERVRRDGEQFGDTLSSLGDAIIATDQASNVTFMNSVAESITGWRFEEVRGKPVAEVVTLINEDTGDNTTTRVMAALEVEDHLHHASPTILIARDGGRIEVDETASPVRNTNGEIVGSVLVFRDVSHQREFEIESSRLAAIVSSSGDAILGQSLEGVVTDWNVGAERLFGYRAEEVIGTNILDTIVPASRRQELVDGLQRVARGEVVEFDTVRCHRDGRELEVAVTLSPIRDGLRRIVGASAIDRDISHIRKVERRRNVRLAVTQIFAEEQDAARAIDRVLAAIGEALDWQVGAYWRFDAAQGSSECAAFWHDGRLDVAAFRQITMRLSLSDTGSMIGRVEQSRTPVWLPDVLQDPDFVRGKEAAAAGLHGGFAWPVAIAERLIGVIEWFSTKVEEADEDLLEMMSTVAGQLAQFLERQEAERALRESEQLYRAIGESIDYGVWVCDPEGRNIYTSDSLLDLVGMTQEQCAEFGWGQALHPDDAEETMAAWQQCVRTGEPWSWEHRFRGVDGDYHPVLARGVPVRDDDGIIRYWAGINLDISAIKEVEEALRETDRRKDEFLAMLAHELRNPLAPIRSGLDLLSIQQVDRQDETIRVMQRQVDHLVRLVDDLLDVSRIMRGRIDLRRETVPLAGVVEGAAEAVATHAQSRRHQLTIDLPDEPVWLNIDSVRMAQVLENLLNNAFKYTDPGGHIEISAVVAGQRVAISVRDNGIGIEEELLPQIFELFTQSSQSLDRAQGGLGIGLTLVKQLVEMHGGSVSAASDGRGKGSVFTIHLPLATELAETTEKPMDDFEASGYHVLVVDDNVGAADMLALLIEQLNGEPAATANDGEEALDKIKALHPQIVLLDIGLPRLSGYEVAYRVREDERLNDVLLIALTGYGQEEDIQRSMEAGFDDHIVKPASVDRLKEVFARADRGRAASEC